MDESGFRRTVCGLCGSERYCLVHEEPADAKKPPADVPLRASPYAISEASLEKPDRIVRCLVCGLVYAVPLSGGGDSLRADYEGMADEDYLREEKGRRAQARRVLKQISGYKRGGRLLDVGCGPGFFLDEARKAGWEVSGVDLSGWAKDHSRRHFGIEVFKGTPAEAGFPDRGFDVVVMNDVLEHLEDPKAVLKEIRRVLKNDGLIYVATPDIRSFLSRLLKAKWWGINKYHLFYFSRRTLERLFLEVGFRPVRYFPYPRIFSVRYWAARLKGYPRFVRWPLECLAGFRAMSERLLAVDLHDQIGVAARKILRLDSVTGGGSAPAESPAAPAGGTALRAQRVIVVLPAYNAEKTLGRTVADIPKGIVDEIILVDDKSSDRTVEIARELGLTVFCHEKNKGYGGNQKTCYAQALARGADVVVMCHPDYQYDPKIIPELVEPILKGRADAVFGSRMMKGGALEGGMPLWKHNANILLTALENVVLGTYLTEYHSGFRAYSAKLLRKVRFQDNSDGFVFDTEIIVQILANYMKIDEVPIRTRYFEEASSIRLGPSIVYGFGILRVLIRYFLDRHGILKDPRLEPADPHG